MEKLLTMSMIDDDTTNVDELFNSLVEDSPVVAEVAPVTETVAETPNLVVDGVVIPNEDSALPVQDDDNGNDDDDDEDDDNEQKVSVRFVNPNRKKPDPADDKYFMLKVIVPVLHDDAEKTSKRITSMVRAKLRETKEAVKASDSYKGKSEADQKAMLSAIKMSSGQILSELFPVQAVIDVATKFVSDAQTMTFETSTPDRVRNSVKAAKEQAAIAYRGMVCAFLQYQMDAVTLYHQLKKLKINSDSEEVQSAVLSALLDPDFGNKSEEDANEYLATFKSQALVS